MPYLPERRFKLGRIAFAVAVWLVVIYGVFRLGADLFGVKLPWYLP